MSTEISISKLEKKYPDGTHALKGVDLMVGKGQVFALLGPNGAGKSTLVNILINLIGKDSGSYVIGGQDPEKSGRLIQRYIAVASQDNELDPGESALNMLVFQGRLFGLSKNEAKERADELIGLFQLESEMNKKSGDLSGGNKRRLHCALALVHRPKVLFLDEPTVGMDPLARSTFWEVITSMNRKDDVTVFLTTQYLDEADKHALAMALIIDGEIKYAGAVSDFKKMVHPSENCTLEESYLTYVKSLSNTKNNEQL